jgi:hypothetical protein
MRWAEHVARTKDKRGAERVLVGRPVEKNKLCRPMWKWEDNIKIYL